MPAAFERDSSLSCFEGLCIYFPVSGKIKRLLARGTAPDLVSGDFPPLNEASLPFGHAGRNITYGLQNAAFPAMSCGAYCYPAAEACAIAVSKARGFEQEHAAFH
jgi:hypothetical protein